MRSPFEPRQRPLPVRNWRDDALCGQVGVEAFFPEPGASAPGTSKRARAICDECTVAAQCLEYALANDERHGFWGGLSPKERSRLRKSMRRAA